MTENQFQLHLGFSAAHIRKQLQNQGFLFDDEAVAEFQKCADAISTLYWAELLKDTEKIRTKLYRQVLRHVKAKNRSKKSKTAAVQATANT